MKKICFVIPYFGKWPSWFRYHLKSCEFNPSINWLFYTDCEIPKNAPGNTLFIKATLDDFNKLATKKIGLNINVKNPYKLCDFKPAYGLIFENYLKGFNFWGHGDIDVIYGDIRKFITDEILSCDLISTLEWYLAGHFTLYKNNKKMNLVFKKNKDYKFVFQNEKTLSFTECNFLSKDLMLNKPIKEERLKTKNMTWLVKDLAEKGYIKIYLKTMCLKNCNQKINFCFNKGVLTDINKKKEILYFHFAQLRRLYEFMAPNTSIIPDKFYMTNNDFYHDIKSSRIKIIMGKIKRTNQKIGDNINNQIRPIETFFEDSHPKLYLKLRNIKRALFN